MGLADTFKVLSDALRRNVLLLLKDGRKTAGELAEELNVTPAALSYHLSIMKKAGLIMEYRQKNYIFYELNATLFEELILWLQQFGSENGGGCYEKADFMDFNVDTDTGDGTVDSLYGRQSPDAL